MRQIAPETLMPFYGWAFLQISGEDEAERRLRSMLRGEGVSFEHFDGILALDSEARSTVAFRLCGIRNKSPMLHALRLIGRSGISRDSVDLDQFECVEESLGYSQLPFDTQVRMLKEWLTSNERICSHFLDLIRWATACPTEVPKQGGWSAFLKKRMNQAEWSPPPLEMNDLADVRVTAITDGRSLLKEGRDLGHCLKTPEDAYPYFLRCLQRTMHVLRVEARDSPVMCATLAIELDEEGWGVGDFQTVGSGLPPRPLRDAAKRLVFGVNVQQGFASEYQEEEADLDIPPFLRRSRQ